MKLIRRALAAVLVTASLLTTPAFAAPAMWRVSDADSEVHLFGSIHVFTRPMQWRTPEFDRELKDADHVYFELVFNEATYATFARVMLVDGRLRDGRTLWDLLTPAEATELRTAVAAAALDPATFDHLTPWMAEMMLSSGLVSGAQVGVELVVDAEIEATRKRGLETADEQISFLAQGSESEQVANLMSTARQVSGLDGSAIVEGMMTAWENGDVAALERLNRTDLGESGDRYNTLITKRNASWVTRIEQMLAENDDAMVIVGAGHLVGAGGVPELLEDRGYKVERIDNTPAIKVPLPGTNGDPRTLPAH